jgi:hypothetical protein
VSRIYLYKLTTDVGQAPCVQDDLLTLAICKPMIRTTAEAGDLIFGFAANHIEENSGVRATDNHLIYIARVDEIFGRDYYGSAEFADRMDCIYEPVGGGFRWRAGCCHGPEHLVHDLGERPDYSRAVVLASRDFRYFGKAGSSDYKAQFPAVKDAVERTGRGHRVNHDEVLQRELRALKDLVWESAAACADGLPDPQSSALGVSRTCRRRAGRSAKCSGS